MMHVPEKYRIKNHPTLSTSTMDGNNGAFMIPSSNNRELWIIASDGINWDAAFHGIRPKWEHVSVHIFDGRRTITPRWDEMCRVKDIFWDPEDLVIQFHPRASEYINMHPNTLHLWRPIDFELPTPPKLAVGFSPNSWR